MPYSPTYNLVSRSAWGAAAPQSNMLGMGSITGIVIHHTAAPNSAQYYQHGGPYWMKSIQNDHMSRGYADIGPHFFIGPDGAIYEGRSLNYRGAHCDNDATTYNENIGQIGIENFVNSNTEGLTATNMDALVRLSSSLSLAYGITTDHIKGHKDVDQTACPGTELYARLFDIRIAVLETVSAHQTAPYGYSGGYYGYSGGAYSYSY